MNKLIHTVMFATCAIALTLGTVSAGEEKGCCKKAKAEGKVCEKCHPEKK